MKAFCGVHGFKANAEYVRAILFKQNCLLTFIEVRNPSHLTTDKDVTLTGAFWYAFFTIS